MSVKGKKILSNIVYYTLIVMALVFSAFFVFALAVKDVAMWTKVLYFVWIGITIATLIFDIICTTTRNNKHISGLIIYVLSIIAVVLALVLYFVNTGATGLATDYFNLFISISFLSLLTTGFTIASWVIGENLVEHSVSYDKLKNKIEK